MEITTSPDRAHAASGEPARLLVVDDDRSVRRILGRALRDAGYDVREAADGREALACLGETTPDAVLMDVTMPGPSGIEVLRVIRREFPAGMLPVVMITSRDAPDELVKGLEAGANDWLAKPVNLAVLLARIENYLRLRESVVSLSEAAEHLQAELQEAARMQRARLPSAPLLTVGDYQAAWFWAPLEEVGGDHLNVIPLGAKHLAFYILDASGHGPAAALLSTALSHALGPDGPVVRAAANGQDSDAAPPARPAQVIERLDRQFAFDSPLAKFATIFYGLLHQPTGELRYCCAGHPSPWLLSSGGTLRPLAGGGLPIGLAAADELHEQTITLAPGDRLFLYTDGLMEVVDAEDAMLGTEGLGEIFRATGGLPLDAALRTIRDAVRAWSAAGHLYDDAAALILERR